MTKIENTPAYCPVCYKLCKNDIETEKCINSHKNEPHKSPIIKENAEGNIKPSPKKEPLSTRANINKLIKLFADKTHCNIQYNNCPCNSCFHNIHGDFQHICWLIILGLRGDYDSKEILKAIEEELI